MLLKAKKPVRGILRADPGIRDVAAAAAGRKVGNKQAKKNYAGTHVAV